MSNSNMSIKNGAHRKTQDYFARTAQRDSALKQEREKEKAADVAKTARLRALRLAKEAADKELAEKEERDKVQGKR